MNKIERAIEVIRKAESLALKYQSYGFHLAFSGGKDSQVIYELAKMAGVKFRPVMQVTTLDPPELMKFVRNNYPDVILERPKINFYNLIVKKKSLPTKMIRYCCQYLKEQSGANTVTILGIRKSESNKRAKRNELEISGRKYSNTLDQFNIDNKDQILCINGKDKILLSPIINWTNSDVWSFIRNNNIEYCELYDKGYHRIGCMFCPMACVRVKQLDRKNYPGVEKLIKKSIQKLCKDNNYGSMLNNDVDEIFNWWVTNDSMKVYKAKKKQYKLAL
ncbi:MAG TPA: phosphoadenosine phosphosulfate reductase family protein [Bacteroidales bacterium]|nr:phosphoadenosine phosphosulfate reductase family protein [Bacteroidales bacterium]